MIELIPLAIPLGPSTPQMYCHVESSWHMAKTCQNKHVLAHYTFIMGAALDHDPTPTHLQII